MNTTSNQCKVLVLILFLLSIALPSMIRAESEILSLAGFDKSRIEAMFPIQNEDSISEIVKLVDRMNRLQPETLKKDLKQESTKLEPGDITSFDGRIEKVQRIPIPAKLAEFIEIRELKQLTLAVSEVERESVIVIVADLAKDAQAGDRVSGFGVTLQGNASEDVPVSAIAAARIQWFPAAPTSVGWKLLADQDVNLADIAGVASRNRQPLTSADTELFYAMLAASDELRRKPNSDVPAPMPIEPVDLLKDPKPYTCQWIRMNAEVVQLTRIAVNEPHRQNQLGSDHYFQIDAMGDLGKVKVKIDPAEGSGGEPAIFQNRYPISIVCKTLPEFLQNKLAERGETDAIVADVVVLVEVDAFFFRLWSYPTEYMRQFGGGDQFGPLLIASDMKSLEGIEPVPESRWIGWAAGIAMGIFIFGMALWSFFNGQRDREVQKQRKQREADQIEFPQ